MKRFYFALVCLCFCLWAVVFAEYVEKGSFVNKTFNTATARKDTGDWKYIYDYSEVELSNEWQGSSSFTVDIKLQGLMNESFVTITSGSFSYVSSTLSGNSGTWTHVNLSLDTNRIFTDANGFGFMLKNPYNSLVEGCKAVRIIYELFPYNLSDSISRNYYNSFFIMRK